MEDLLRVGVITKTHGLKGEVKVYPLTDDISRFNDLREVILEPESDNLRLEIESVRFFKNLVILKFRGIDDINDITMHLKKGLYVTRDNAVPLSDDEYFVADLIGLKVILDDGTTFGTLKDVISTGANDVYVVSHDGGEVLIPAIKKCIIDVSIEEGFMKVHLLEGLI